MSSLNEFIKKTQSKKPNIYHDANDENISLNSSAPKRKLEIIFSADDISVATIKRSNKCSDHTDQTVCGSSMSYCNISGSTSTYLDHHYPDIPKINSNDSSWTIIKKDKLRKLVTIDVKPVNLEIDLNRVWKKITKSIKMPGLQWADGYYVEEIGFGINKLSMGCILHYSLSADDVVRAVRRLSRSIKSVEIVDSLVG